MDRVRDIRPSHPVLPVRRRDDARKEQPKPPPRRPRKPDDASDTDEHPRIDEYV